MTNMLNQFRNILSYAWNTYALYSVSKFLRGAYFYS